MAKVRRLVLARLRTYSPFEEVEPGTVYEFEEHGDARWPPIIDLDRAGATTDPPPGARIDRKVDPEVVIAAGGNHPDMPPLHEQ